MEKFHTHTVEETIEILKTDKNHGLKEKEALKRLLKNGKNELLEEKKKGIVSKFAGQFNDFLIIILIIAAVISFVVGISEGNPDITEPVIILLIVVLNAAIGVFQEMRAEKSLLMLKAMSAPKAKVLRDGKALEVASGDVVCGDVLLFETGDIIAADARLIEAMDVHIDESAITGESNPVIKNYEGIFSEDAALGDRSNMLFSSTSVVSGRGRAIVTATGMQTEVGKVAGLILNSDNPETPLQRKMADFGKKIGILALGICAVVFLAGVIKGYSVLQMFITAVSLAVAAIPEGLPAIVTVMLALGVSNLAKRKALVRHLPSVETLGSAGVICTDKTGTITENKMKVERVYTEDESLLCLLGSMCCAENTHNPTELAILNYAEKIVENREKCRILKEIPFSSKSKKMTVLCKMGAENRVISKGAADILIKECTRLWNGKEEINLSYNQKREIEKKLEEMAEEGLRVIAVTYKNTKERDITEKNMVFSGLFAIEDPPRTEAGPAVEECKKAGIIPVMITGDHLKTAVAIAKKTGIYEEGKKAITGFELDKISDEELFKSISDYRVFARVSPEHKARIVKAWQRNGVVVAMTGDGVNDAPALKIADIGCSLGVAGTDVAKAASDMILTDDNFATVVEAVRYGRMIFKNIKKTVRFLLSSNTGEIVTIFFGMLMGFPPPLLAVQLLWVNLVTDSLPAIALGMDNENEDLMNSPPRNESFFTKETITGVLLEGTVIGMLAIIAFCIGCFKFSGVAVGRTMAFCTLSISQLMHSFNVRSEKSIFKSRPLKNRFLVFSTVTGILMQGAVVGIRPLAEIFKSVPLGIKEWIAVAVLAFVPIVVSELQKCINLIIRRKKSTKI